MVWCQKALIHFIYTKSLISLTLKEILNQCRCSHWKSMRVCSVQNLQIFSLCKDYMVWRRSTQIASCRQCWIESIFFLYNYIWDLSIFYEIKCVNNWFPVCNGVIDGPGLTKLYCFFFPQQIREPLKRVSSSLISFWFRNMPMGNLTLTIKKAPLLSVHVIKIPSSSSLERKKVASSLSRH